MSQVSAHLRIFDAYGDANPGVHGTGLAYEPGIPQNGKGDVVNFQFDTTVFSSPAVPATDPASPYKKLKRQYLAQGCGGTLSNIHFYWLNQPKHYTPYPAGHALTWPHRLIHFFMRPFDPQTFTQVQSRTQQAALTGKIVKVKPGGWINIGFYQVNADGAGPFKCKIDYSGTGTKFQAWLAPNMVTQPPSQGPYGIYAWGAGKQHRFQVKLPPNLPCAATYAKTTNVCILRCENPAVNGPFGGCIPFQVILPPPPPKPKPVVKVVTSLSKSVVAPGKTTLVSQTKKVVVTPKPPVPTVKPIVITKISVNTKKPEPTPMTGYPGYDVGKNNYDEGAAKFDFAAAKAKEVGAAPKKVVVPEKEVVPEPDPEAPPEEKKTEEEEDEPENEVTEEEPVEEEPAEEEPTEEPTEEET
ncbi:hypothetical protein ABW20_dc0106504 [Dactylellina cionopaga]|nr:hypothetical protein ABW20_dc0106504 [Dactylellina cionopaga]